jgi:hypothetical protein
VHAKVGTRVGRGDALCTVEFDEPARARATRRLVEDAFELQDVRPGPSTRPLVLETLA